MIINIVGKKYLTNEGYYITIVEYFNRRNCTIVFENGIILKNMQFGNIENGNIKNPYHKSVYGVGCIGQGGHKTKKDNKPTKIYRIWKGIIGRCYSEKVQRKNPTYKDVTVCKEWHNFQNFAEWYDENYNPETMQGWQLDKDILFKCNKIYSPETCAFVPKEINILFIKPKHNLPTGVTCRRNKFQVNISKNKIRMFLGAFDTLEEAFQVYKTAKELWIKEVADLWRDKIDQKTYNAMYNWKIEIDD